MRAESKYGAGVRYSGEEPTPRCLYCGKPIDQSRDARSGGQPPQFCRGATCRNGYRRKSTPRGQSALASQPAGPHH